MAGKHARLSASSAERWMNCAGSVAAIGDADDGGSQAAADGTFAHHIAAECLTSGRDPSAWLGNKTIVDGFEVECTQEMVDAIRVYLEDDAADARPGDETWVEMPLTEALQQHDPDLGGTGDRVRYRSIEQLLIVKDFKYGVGTFVDVDDNKQLRIYALGALLSLPKGKPMREVRIDIVQPRYEGAAPVRPYSFPVIELFDFAEDVRAAAEATRDPAASLQPGPWCRKTFCPVRRTCPALEAAQTAVVAAQFSDVVPYDPQELSLALAQVPLVRERLSAIEEFAYREAQRGVVIPGFKLVDKQARRQWTADEATVAKWAEARGVEPYERKLRSPAQIEKGLKKAEREGIAELCAAVSSGTVLVPMSDKRQPVGRVSSADDFTAIGGNADETGTGEPPAFSII